MVPSTQLTLYYLGTYKNPPGVWADLVDGQVEIVGKLMVQLRQWQVVNKVSYMPMFAVLPE